MTFHSKKRSISKRTSHEITYELSGEEIYQLMLRAGIHTLTAGANVKRTVIFSVPSDGDYSGMNIDITADDPVVVRIIEDISESEDEL